MWPYGVGVALLRQGATGSELEVFVEVFMFTIYPKYILPGGPVSFLETNQDVTKLAITVGNSFFVKL